MVDSEVSKDSIPFMMAHRMPSGLSSITSEKEGLNRIDRDAVPRGFFMKTCQSLIYLAIMMK